jgi:hypothetical protein
MLNHVCSSAYSRIPKSRLAKPAKDDFGRFELREALGCFFRWVGAPCHHGPDPLTAEEAAARLHSAFLMERVHRLYLAPLDQLGLEDKTKRPHEALRRVRFGTCEIVLLDDDYIGEFVPVDALKRFGRLFWFPSGQLIGFYYLAVRSEEKAGPIGQRGRMNWLYVLSYELDRIEIYKPLHAGPVEDALFTMLLYLIDVKNPSHREKPFAVPWVYSFTDDPFFAPPPSPDPACLPRIPIDPETDTERANRFEFGEAEIEEALGRRWRRLQSALDRAASAGGNFHPLTKHFFVEVFAEDGIDEIVALISCVEATLMLSEKWPEDELLKRYRRLGEDDQAFNFLKCAYQVRNKYLHALADSRETVTLNDVAKCRLAVAKAADEYLTFADAKREQDREVLLRSLEQ